ncbi:type II secretion system minor pseudopilin GspK [Salinicola halophilus]|uniref:type II secretion system minor pseudopilin GspK n=1 Tax=Salinicola halophilus TaxID=184065 RepID=UPI001EF8A623|nr:type II secretion system minor pseudopilin GspK [Salinicola halophilus]
MSHHRQDGAALLMVLMCLALCALLLTQLAEEGGDQLTRMRLLQNETQADFYAAGAETIAIRALTDSNVRQASLWWQTLAGRPLDYPTDEGDLRLRVRDLRTCFNVNALAGDDSGLAERQLRDFLSRLPASRLDGLTPTTLAARLADWVDDDTQARPNGFDGADYARGDPPRVSADTLMQDTSEINWIEPLNPQRFQRLPELCALPETGPWRLNLNTLSLTELPLLEALFEGRAGRGTLIRLINARPATGYHSAEAVRAQLGDNADWFDTDGDRLTLTPDYVALDLALTLGGERFHYWRLLKAEGISSWSPLSAAARVRVLQRRDGYVSSAPDAGTEPANVFQEDAS